MTDRLYVVTRADLPAGAQAVQSMHAAMEFAREHQELWRSWVEGSNTLALLSVADEAELEALARRAESKWLRLSRFHEPDLGGALTAISIEPAGRKVCERLPLTLSQ